MSPRTKTRPLTDGSYWRRLLAIAHPDRNAGAEDLFVFLTALREHVSECLALEAPASSEAEKHAPSSSKQQSAERIPFDADLGAEDEFWRLTARALSVGSSVAEPYRSVLALLEDCAATDHGRRAMRQMRGASYKQLALIAHRTGMSKTQRCQWYEVAKRIPLSEQHAHHILTRLITERVKAKGAA